VRDKEILDDQEPLFPVAGSPAPVVPPVDEVDTIDEQFPDEERDAGDEMIAPDDDALLDAGRSPEFDHSLRKRASGSNETS
jgi:hypothetical protein